MIMRYRWYRLNSPISHAALLRSITEGTITPKKHKGYTLLHSNKKEIEFQYFWREVLTATTLDDEGNESLEEVYTVLSQHCYLIKIRDKYLLRLKNPGRSNREIFNSLEEITGMGFSTKSLFLSDDNINMILKNLDVSRLVRVKLTGGVKSDDLVARIELASNIGINLKNITLLDGVSYQTDYASYESMKKGVKGNFSYTPTGLVKISGQLSPFLFSLIEKSMLAKV